MKVRDIHNRIKHTPYLLKQDKHTILKYSHIDTNRQEILFKDQQDILWSGPLYLYSKKCSQKAWEYELKTETQIKELYPEYFL